MYRQWELMKRQYKRISRIKKQRYTEKIYAVGVELPVFIRSKRSVKSL